jgi:hypothetical protein
MTTTTNHGRNFNRAIGRQVCETVFGGIPAVTRCTLFGEIRTGNHATDGNEGKWEVVIEAGMGLTGTRSREDFQVFATQAEAEDFAATHADYWSHSRTGSRMNKGNRTN